MDGLDSFEKLIMCIAIAIVIPTFLGNVLILVCIRRFHWLQTPLNALVGSLAVSDLLFALAIVPGYIVGAFLEANTRPSFCLLYIGVLVTLLLASLLQKLAISVERYYSVGFPWKHRTSKRSVYVKVFIPLSWSGSFLFSLIPWMGWNALDTDDQCELFTAWPRALKVTLNVLIVVIIIVKTTLFSLVVRIALKRLPTFSSGGIEAIRIRRQIAKMYVLIAVSAIFILCWAPFCFITFFRLIVDSERLKVAESVALLLGVLNCAFNWLIYGLKNSKFRKAFSLVLCQWRSGDRPASARPSSREISS
ncbi:beta-2 adrenergic receptor-like [Mya arenaria]|uniref:beta-2 adrenergic receptor-like n=1 Tax=Mya arenaria TaxID=6604 RepID=UPI0022E2299E|nr:beta-2 adrenergic receptor-like [Mya arenaria]